MNDNQPEPGVRFDQERWALFLDFDGTLVDIAPRPDAVRVEPSLLPVLDTLRQRLGGALAIVSGRPITVLDQFLAPHRFDAAGLHGLEHRLAENLFPCRPEDHPGLRDGIERLKTQFPAETGIIIEDKLCSVGIHWRLAPLLADRAREAAQSLAGELGSDYRIQFGKAVAEILPAASGKGRIIEKFLAQPPYAGRLPVFIGDDLTDENGFEVVNARGGLSVRVGEGATIAHYRIASPAKLRQCLTEWAEGRLFEIGTRIRT